MHQLQKNLIGLGPLSTRLGVSMRWLKCEAQNGRVPHVRAGRRFLFNAAAVETALAERAAIESAIAELLKPNEVDLLLRYPFGRAVKLARKHLLPHVVLPDGSIRFDARAIKRVVAAGTNTELPSRGAKL